MKNAINFLFLKLHDSRNYNNNLFVDIMSFYLTGEAVGLAYWSEFLPTITKNFIIETFDFLGADAGELISCIFNSHAVGIGKLKDLRLTLMTF